MGKEILTFGNIEIEKNKKGVNIKKVLVSNKISSGEKNYKYFIGCLYNNHKVKPLHIMFPKTSVYVKSYDEQTKWMYLLIEDDYLLDNNITYKIILFGIKSAIL